MIALLPRSLAPLAIVFIACTTKVSDERRAPNLLADSLRSAALTFFAAAIVKDRDAAALLSCDSIATEAAMRLSAKDSSVFANLGRAATEVPQPFAVDTVALRFVVPRTPGQSTVATVTFVRKAGRWYVCRFMIPEHI
jgi:hypothetical protein